MLAKTFIFDTNKMNTNTMKEKNQKRLKETMKAVFWTAVGAIGATLFFKINSSKVLEENRDLKTKNKLSQRRIKHLEHQAETGWMRGWRAGRDSK